MLNLNSFNVKITKYKIKNAIWTVLQPTKKEQTLCGRISKLQHTNLKKKNSSSKLVQAVGLQEKEKGIFVVSQACGFLVFMIARTKECISYNGEEGPKMEVGLEGEEEDEEES